VRVAGAVAVVVPGADGGRAAAVEAVEVVEVGGIAGPCGSPAAAPPALVPAGGDRAHERAAGRGSQHECTCRRHAGALIGAA
jgi:hypothetical protein